MKKLLILLLTLSLCSVSLTSCSRVEERAKGELKTVELTKLDSIPLEYGSFVGVTVYQKFPRTAQLWFENDDRTIRMVNIALDENRVSETVTVIPRY